MVNISIIGSGALGTFLAWKLAKKHEVTLICRESQLAHLSSGRIHVLGERGGFAQVNVATTIPKATQLCILAVKSFDLKGAISLIQTFPGDFPLIFPQNGLRHLKIVKENFPNRGVFASVTYGASLVEPGSVTFGGEGVLELSSPKLDLKVVDNISRAFLDSNMNVKINKNPVQSVWKKAGVNCCINPLTAILECKNGDLLRSSHVVGIMRRISFEVEEVAKKENVPLEGIFNKTIEVCRKTGRNRSSMLQDILSKRKTEVRSLNVEVSRIGKEHGIDVLQNDLLGKLVLAKEKSYL